MQAIDHAIALLDALDMASEDLEPDQDGGDADDACDYEDDGTAEPMLGASERHPSAWGWSDYYRCSSGSQTHWWAGNNGPLNDGETEPGYDEPEGDDERCASGDVDLENSLGWAANVSQLGIEPPPFDCEDREETALERHGRGFVRSGPDDAEDGHDAEIEHEGGDDRGEDADHYASIRPLTPAERAEIATLQARAATVRRVLHV